MAKVRSMAKPVPARVTGDRLHFVAPEYGVAPGQAAVLYDGERVLGGGWMQRTRIARFEFPILIVLASVAKASAPCTSMSAAKTVAPSRANIRAVARPMPAAAPVTTATWPENVMLIVMSS